MFEKAFMGQRKVRGRSTEREHNREEDDETKEKHLPVTKLKQSLMSCFAGSFFFFSYASFSVHALNPYVTRMFRRVGVGGERTPRARCAQLGANFPFSSNPGLADQKRLAWYSFYHLIIAESGRTFLPDSFLTQRRRQAIKSGEVGTALRMWLFSQLEIRLCQSCYLRCLAAHVFISFVCTWAWLLFKVCGTHKKRPWGSQESCPVKVPRPQQQRRTLRVEACPTRHRPRHI